MRLPALASALLLCSSALAQTDGTAVRWKDMGWTATGRTAEVTTAAKTLYVETTGSDSNNCTSVATACLTGQGALNKIPKQMYHAYTIQFGTGTFTSGFVVSGFTVHAVPGRASGLFINGTLTTATVATGSASGTATSGSASSGATFGVLNDTSQSWTDNDLRGKLLTLTGGTGFCATCIHVIASNTATSITVVGGFASSAPASGTTYTIQDWGTTISGTPSAVLGPDSSTIGSLGVVNFIGNSGGASANFSQPIQLHKVKVTGTSRVIGMFDAGAPVMFRWVHSSGTSGNLSAQGTSPFWWRNSYMVGTSGSQMVVDTTNRPGGTGFSLTNAMISGGATAIAAATPYMILSGAFLFNQSTASIHNQFTGQTGSQVVGTRIDCNSTGGDGYRTAYTDAPAPQIFGATTLDISNCATAINLRGPMAAAYLATVSGTGNTTGVSAIEGAKAKVSSAVTLTGTTELSVDGSGSTLANMRAQTPKHIKNSNYFSVIYE